VEPCNLKPNQTKQTKPKPTKENKAKVQETCMSRCNFTEEVAKVWIICKPSTTNQRKKKENINQVQETTNNWCCLLPRIEELNNSILRMSTAIKPFSIPWKTMASCGSNNSSSNNNSKDWRVKQFNSKDVNCNQTILYSMKKQWHPVAATTITTTTTTIIATTTTTTVVAAATTAVIGEWEWSW
jgi:hypothetical protein